jgi:hypothetical protein
MSFKISGEGRQFLSQLIEDRNSKVSGSAPRYLYHRRKLKRRFGTHARDNVWRARHLSLFTTQTVRHPAHCKWGIELAHQQCQPTWRGEVARKASHHAHDPAEERMASVPRWSNPNKPTAWNKLAKEPQPLKSFFMLFCITPESTHFLAKSVMIQTGKPTCIMALGGYPD